MIYSANVVFVTTRPILLVLKLMKSVVKLVTVCNSFSYSATGQESRFFYKLACKVFSTYITHNQQFYRLILYPLSVIESAIYDDFVTSTLIRDVYLLHVRARLH